MRPEMMKRQARTSRDYQRTHVRRFRGGLVASAVLHVLVFLTFAGQRLPPSPFSAAGERRGDDRAAAGGGMQAVELRMPEAEPPVPPEPELVPAPVIEVEPPPEPEQTFDEVPVIALAQGPGTAEQEGPGNEPGLPNGIGRGDGGTEEQGRFRVVPPRPRGLILPPGDRPASVRGREFDVWVYVSAAGRVVPDSTRIDPGTGDRRFDRRLREHAAGWVFEAAKRDGRPVAEWFRYTIVM